MATQTRTGRQVMLLAGTGAQIRARLAFYIRCYGPDFRLADLSSGRGSAPIRRTARVKSGTALSFRALTMLPDSAALKALRR
ncbi:hypothetical protein ACE6ED_05275 [Paenibacillus sp. CN-4]|uniref:hypothetical protein n=1 Tax=Paenibacillus nanchangensis TaxID=3348343 RepID=UPI00397AA62E